MELESGTVIMFSYSKSQYGELTLVITALDKLCVVWEKNKHVH